jgi:hypothetical protein
MTKLPGTTRIGVRRIVIEVNRDLTVEQFETLDETLKKLGLVKATKVTLHDEEQPRKPRAPRVSKPLTMPTVLPSQPPESKAAQSNSA